LEINFDAALARARELDDFFSAHDKPVGPLHGLPVSLKDQFHIKGLDTSMGYVGWIGKERPVESELIRELVELGAIPIAKVMIFRQCDLCEFQNADSSRQATCKPFG
jgi:amidase